MNGHSSQSSDMEENQDPLSSRSSYFSAIETATDTSTDDCDKDVTTNGQLSDNHHTSSNSNHIMSTPSSKSTGRCRPTSNSSPTVKHLGRHQKRAVGSFMETPSQSNWDELVKTMKKGIIIDKSENSGEVQPHQVRKLSFEPAQIHSAKDNNKSPVSNNVSENSLHESVEEFAQEHGIFLKAVLQLLHEKDQPYNQNYAQVELSEIRFDDIQDVIKIGSLKKASKRVKGVWNVKFVEIRRGVFSYYGDNAVNTSKSRMRRRTSAPSLNASSSNNKNDEQTTRYNNASLSRKDILLHASECTCRAVKLRSMMRPNTSNRRNVTGAVFELRRDGRRHLLMANTVEERRHWIQAIHDAMIGASVTRGDNFLEYQVDDCGDDRDHMSYHGVKVPMNTPYSNVMEKYLDIQDAIKSAQSKIEYKNALSRLNDKEQMIVPVEWIKTLCDSKRNTFVEHELSSCVEQLWKDLCRDSVKINGVVLMGDAYRGPDRILGMLTRQILHNGGTRNSCTTMTPDRITEAQAVSYARDILLSSDRTRSGGDSYYCAEHMCLNRELVAMCPCSVEAEPLSISVSPAGFGKGSPADDMHDVVCGWASVRIPNKQFARTFLILGRNILNCYAMADPIPHQLREKIHLKDAIIDDSLIVNGRRSQSEQNQSENNLQFGILMNNKRFRRDFQFENESSCSFWRTAFEAAAQSVAENSFRESINNHEMDFLETSSELLDESKDCRYSGATPRLLSRNSPPAVDVEINVSAEYKIVTLDPQGEECNDTWAYLKTVFIQKFRLSGGSRGRISRGDEVVKLELL